MHHAAFRKKSEIPMRCALIPALVLLCLATLVAAFFGSLLVADRQFALGDIADFYYPLYQRVQEEWQAGRIPLWEMEENAGMPLLGNPSAAVLYPGKVVYGLFPYPWAARLYVIGHVLLAFAGQWLLLRSWGVGPAGRALGGLAYAFGAPVVFQYSNIIFLVGAAGPRGVSAPRIGCCGWEVAGRSWSLPSCWSWRLWGATRRAHI